MTMRVISTVHKKGWEAYGEQWMVSLDAMWPEDTDIRLYTEGFDSPAHGKRIESVEKCEAFKAKYKHYKPVLWTYDVVRWSNKVYANYDALRDYDGLAVWLDCDCETLKPITEDFIRSMLPKDHYMAMFKRAGMPTETGFVIRDCSHPMHKAFMDTWLQWFESGSFKTLSQWCDASTMDATVRAFEKHGMQTASLSGPHERELSPMDLVPLAQYIVHKKGARKWQ